MIVMRTRTITMLLSFLVFLCISFNGGFSSESLSSSSSNSNVAHFEMIHRHDPRILAGRTLNRSEMINELIESDKLRIKLISRRLSLAATAAKMSRRRVTESTGAAGQGHLQQQHRPRRTRQGVEGVGHGGGGVLGGDNSSFSLPIRSAVYTGQGNYFVSLKVGTPAQLFLVVVDTGSSLTWMKCKIKCKPRRAGGGGGGEVGVGGRMGWGLGRGQGQCGVKFPKREPVPKRLFHPERSRSFRPVACSTMLCREGLERLTSVLDCPTPKSPCIYNYSYADHSYSKGIFAHESVTVNLANGHKKKLHDMLIGCSNDWITNETNKKFEADGILGLGANIHSLIMESNVVKDFHGGKFSYCLMDRLSDKRQTNYLTFGDRPHEEMPPNMQYIHMDVIDESYMLSALAIYVDGVKLNIPMDVLTTHPYLDPHANEFQQDAPGGILLDSGTSLTYWLPEIYGPIMEALAKPLLRKFRKVVDPNAPFEFCFTVNNTNGNGEAIEVDDSLVPKLEIHFKSGVVFKPPTKNYFIFFTENINCIGFLKSEGNPGDDIYNILGNTMQQSHMWEFDPSRKLVGFAPSTCILRHHHKF